MEKKKKKQERTQQHKNERVGITIDFPDIKSIINEYLKKHLGNSAAQLNKCLKNTNFQGSFKKKLNSQDRFYITDFAVRIFP